MDNAFRKVLAKALEQIEGGADAEHVLARFPEHAHALSGHLGLWEQLASAERVHPEAAAFARGQRAMMSALAANSGSTRQMFNRPNLALVKAAAVVAGFILLAGGTAGVSAALGGPDVAGSPLRAVGVGQNHDSDDGQAGQHEDGCITTGSPTLEPSPSPAPADTEENDHESQCKNNDCAAGATPASDTPTPAPGTSADDEHQCGDNTESTDGPDGPNDNANPNASEHCANSLDGRNNASDKAANGDAHANPRAFEGGNGGNCDASTGQGSGGSTGDGNPNGQGNGNANGHGPDRPNPTPHGSGNGKPESTPKGPKN